MLYERSAHRLPWYSQLPALLALVAPCSCLQDAMSETLDWGRGLPYEILSAVGGGHSALIAMREVNRTWQAGFDHGVRVLRVGRAGPSIPLDGSFPEFPRALPRAHSGRPWRVLNPRNCPGAPSGASQVDHPKAGPCWGEVRWRPWLGLRLAHLDLKGCSRL